MEVSKSERAILSRDLSDFLIELSVALHRHSMYPTGHPSLEPAIDAVLRRADKLLQDRASIAFGVARRQLIIEGVTTDPGQPVLRRLAESLHRHHIGAVSVSRDVQPNEISEALSALATEADRDGPVGLKGGQITWPHLKLHPISFADLAIADTSQQPEGAVRHSAEDVELWIGLARAALSAKSGEESGEHSEPSTVAQAINDHPSAEAFDQVIVGYLQQIAHELKTSSGPKADDLRNRTSRLIQSLRPETLRRLVKMGGDAGQRSQFVLDATHGMAVDAVLEIVKAAADASGQTISHGLVRMLSKLAQHAELGSDLARPRADLELREQVSRLLADWRLEDPNPEEYGRVLQMLATTPTDGPISAHAVAAEPEPLRILQMSLESGAFGPLAEKAVDAIVETGHMGAVLNLVAVRPDDSSDVADALLSRLTRPAALQSLLAHEPIDVASLDGLMPRLTLEGYRQLLDALATSESRATRRRLIDRLARTAVDITPLVMALLEDERWYVQRNMLVLLERVGRLPDGFSVIHWTTHPDARVRCEAVRLQLMLPHERALGIGIALNDIDRRVVHLGLTAIQPGCPPELVDRVIDLALSAEGGDELRFLAVSALARIRHASVRNTFLQLADGGRTLLGRLRLPPKTPVLVAVVRALAETWADDPYAAAVLAVAAESPDRELRDAVSPSAT